jgi:copper transport protein
VTAAARVAAGLIGALIAVAGSTPLAGHSGLRFASPLEGSTLGASPTHVQLTFVERPEPSLATIRVSDVSGQTFQIGQPELLGGDPLTLTIALRELPRGVYTVNWRVVSAVDGHATAGAFSFGVQMAPTGPPPTDDPPASTPSIEMAGRFLFLLGLIVVIGAATYELARLGEASWMRLAGAGILIAAAGLVLLIAAQWRASNAGLAAVIDTAIGRAWIGRGAAMAVAIFGLGFAGAGWRRPALVRLGAALVWLAACSALTVHAFYGHAAAGRVPVAATVGVHAIHAVAAGIWIGGLVVVIAGLRSTAEAAHARALRRFSMLAAIGLALVTITGIARSLHEVGSWEALTTNTYGTLVIVKMLLLLSIAVLGATNRWRHLPGAAATTQPLRRTAIGEIGLAVLAIAIAGALSTLPPPAAANVLPGIEASGADFATTVRATLRAVSDQPGPNRFTVAIADYDSGNASSPDRVDLRFTPLDDPDIAPTTLPLTPDGEGRFTGTGAHVSFDGRWRVDVLMERGSSSIDVPLEIEARSRPQRVSVLRVPNQAPIYTVDLNPLGSIQVIVDPERPGEAQLQISCVTVFAEPLPVRRLVVTASSNDAPVRTLVTNRADRHQYLTKIFLERGMNRITVIARTETDARLRATFELHTSN